MREIFRYFNIITKHSHLRLDRILEPYHLCSCHRVFIVKIVEEPGITRDRIKTIAHIHPSNTTRIIDFLEEEHYLIKKVLPRDKRICALYPTDRLKEVYDVLAQAEKEWIEIITEGFTEAEKKKYLSFLKRSADLSAPFTRYRDRGKQTIS